MKRSTPMLFALLALLLASLACDLSDPFNMFGQNFSRGGVACEYEPGGTGDTFTCRCSASDRKLSGLRGYELQDLTDEQLNLLVCGLSNPSTSQNNGDGSLPQNDTEATEPPAMPTVTPTLTPLPAPTASTLTACDFAARYVNIALETDASFDPQAFSAQFSDSSSTLQSACELAPGSSDLYTCRIPESAALPAKLELTYFGKPFSTYNLDATLCSTNDHGKGPAQPGDGPNDEGPTGAQPALDCTTPPFPAGCK